MASPATPVKNASLPEFHLLNRQRKQAVNMKWLHAAASDALLEIMRLKHPDAVRNLPEELPVLIVSDQKMAQFHQEYLGDPTATDVISFDHGDVIVSACTAAREAAERGFPLEQELLLYILHGWLHLRGFDDLSPSPRTRMHRVQNHLLKRILSQHEIDKPFEN